MFVHFDLEKKQKYIVIYVILRNIRSTCSLLFSRQQLKKNQPIEKTED
jgi:hypothetical protein